MAIKTCICDHEAQDKFHGDGNRVHTPIRKKNSSDPQRWRCTVCGRERT